MLGIVTQCGVESEYSLEKLRSAQVVIDTTPAISKALLTSLQWAADYYHQPIGEVLLTALPKAIRRGRALKPKFTPVYQLTEAGRNTDAQALTRAPVQKQVFERLQASSTPLDHAAVKDTGSSWRVALTALVKKDW